MQKRLASNRPPEAVHGGTSEASWLTGLLFDTEGNRFTPTHTTKRGRHYRYYVSQAMIRGRKADGRSASRLPAREIEGIVLKELEAATASPHRLLELISHAPSDPEEMNTIVRAANAFGEQLGRHEAVTTAVSKVVLGSNGVTISVCRKTLRGVIGLAQEGLRRRTGRSHSCYRSDPHPRCAALQGDGSRARVCSGSTRSDQRDREEPWMA